MPQACSSVDAVLVAGGAQAIGALAFGLADPGLDPVDRIVGPGNAWVTAAKLEVAAIVGIDLPAGPSEGMVLADAGADPVIVAADLVTQAEHGPDSPAILVTTSQDLADAVEREIARSPAETRATRDPRLGPGDPRPDRARAGPRAAIAFVDDYAPEHLSIDVEDARPRSRAFGTPDRSSSGRWAPESAGDYATGANHVLPTGGLARACDPLGVEAFGRYTQVQRIDEGGLGGDPGHGGAPGDRRGADRPPPRGRGSLPEAERR